MKFSRTTRSKLGHYVYALVDPRDGFIFYVGKANANNRAFDHLKIDKGESRKLKRIREIRVSGMEPEVHILRYGLPSKDECFTVEAAIIDALRVETLTNEVRGHGIEKGRQTAKEVEQAFGSKPVAVEDLKGRFMVLFIHQTYSPTQSEQEIYDNTRQYWHQVAAAKREPREERSKLDYPTALAVVDGVVVRVYSIEKWFPAGTTFSTRGINRGKDKWEFVGQIIDYHKLKGKRLTENGEALPAQQKGYRYIN